MANGLNLQSSGLTFTTGDVVRNIITDTGRSGLGILSPDAMLHVVPTGSTPSVKFEGLASGTDARVLASDANGVVSYRSDVLVGGSISNNVITLTETDNGTTNLTVQAVTAVTYNNAWDIALAGTGTIGSSPINLPFVTGGTYSNGTITLGINDGLEGGSISISGIDGDDTFVTGATFSSGTATLTRNDGVDVDITGIWTSIPNSALANDDVTIGTTAIALGASSTTLAGLTSVTSASFSGPLTGNVTGNASTASALQTGRDIAITGDITAVGVTFDGSQNISLSASIDAGVVDTTELANDAVTTAKILDGNVTNAKLENSSLTVNAPSGSDPVISLGGALNFTSSDGTVAIDGNSTTDTIDFRVTDSVNTYVTGGTFSSGDLTLELNDGSSAETIGGLWTNIPKTALVDPGFVLGITPIELGDTVGTIAGLTSVSSTVFVGDLQGNADSADVADAWSSSMTLTLGTDLSGNVSFDGSQNVTLNASIVSGSVDTDELADASVTDAKLAGSISNGKLANSKIVITDGTTASDINLGDTITFADGTGLNVAQAAGTVTYSIDSSVVTLSGTQTLTNKTINGSQLVDASVSNAKLANSAITLIGDSGVDQTISLGDSMTFVGGSGIDFVGANTDTMNVNLDTSVVQFKSEKGVANGYASLDGSGKVPAAQLPASIFNYLGAWNADTNTPTLANGTGNSGDVYRVTVAGTSLGEDWTVGDLALYDGAVWQRVDGDDAVESVNGQQGVVVLDTDDISEGANNKYDVDVVLNSGSGISATGTYPNFTITNTDLGSSQTFFKTFNTPAGSAAVASSNNDSLTFTTSDSSIVITGNGSDEIDIKVAGSVNTNIFNTDGTLSGARTLTQAGNTLAFTGGDFTVDGTTFVVDDSKNAVGIGVAAPDDSAVLDLVSTTKGFLFPRMTEAERGLIGAPATGLMVYQTDGDEGVYIKKSFGWVQVI
jgi:hypothetical protein